MQPEQLADVVVQAVQTALAPVRARVAAVEAEVKTVGDLRERVAVMETKAPPVMPPDLSERVLRVEERTPTKELWTALTANVTDMRTRLDVLDPTKAAPVDDDDLAASLTGLLRKELAGLEPAPRIQRRVVRDGAGRVERVIDEPIA